MYMDALMSQIGKRIAQRENSIIIEGLLSGAGKEFVDGQADDKIKEAIDWISSNIHYPDRMVIYPSDGILLAEKGIIMWQLPRPLREQKGSHFFGITNGVDVYTTPLIERGTAVIYGMDEIMLMRTPLRIGFDNMEHPNYLTVAEECISGPIYEKAVAKIKPITPT